MNKTAFTTLAIAQGISSTTLPAPYAFAQSSTDQHTIQQLRQQLNEMQARLERLENQQKPSSTDTARLADNSSGNSANSDNSSIQGSTTQGDSSTTRLMIAGTPASSPTSACSSDRSTTGSIIQKKAPLE